MKIATEERDALITRYLPFAYSIARRYYGIGRAKGWAAEDLRQEAALKLTYAANKYDPEGLHKGRPFPTIAAFAIRRHLRKTLGLDEDVDIAEVDTMPLAIVTPLQPPVWMQSRITRELEALPSSAPSVEEIVVARAEGIALSAALEYAFQEHLSTRQRFVLAHRFGLAGDGHIWTCAEVGAALGLHKSTISRTQAKALARLRAALTTEGDEGTRVLRHLEELQATRQRRKARVAA